MLECKKNANDSLVKLLFGEDQLCFVVLTQTVFLHLLLKYLPFSLTNLYENKLQDD